MKSKLTVQNLSDAEIDTKVLELRNTLKEETFSKAISEDKNTSRLSKPRKEIAKLLTELNRRRRLS